ncbi:glycosyltransferase family 1 protein [Leptolyngbya sp. CCNP1308]|uniref:glycosyltransferase family 4 protein n=1 Tax=Leptolyngbya sp. CCNP1308 TaxID=3110255 RepID=UPI002B20857C|nr:glycosyltransferase family 1 protein [Leptolyngbya sp. CCNP1308]MEA5448612.1 glycosyltransferase family 1 protein [Leptolyngbya sp. CCNP1308]
MRVLVIRRAKGASFSMDVYADGLIEGLRQARPDWSVEALTPSFSEYSGSVLNRIDKYFWRYLALPQQVSQRDDIDIFHVIDHSDGHFAYSLRRAQRRVVVTCHDLINFVQPENITTQALAPWVSTMIWKYAVEGICKADHVVTVSNYTANDVTKVFGLSTDHITAIHNGVESDFRPWPERGAALRQHYGLSLDTFCLLNVGSNHPRKNVITALQAVALLHQRGLPVHFLKAGADFTPAQKEFIDSKNLSDWVSYVGKPSKDQLVDLYNAADLLIAPSLYEGFGITVLEAMACGTPVVTSNATALPEVVGTAGLMAPPDDVEAMATAVMQMQQNPAEYRQFVEKGLAHVQTFTWKAHGERVAKVYENVLSQTP